MVMLASFSFFYKDVKFSIPLGLRDFHDFVPRASATQMKFSFFSFAFASILTASSSFVTATPIANATEVAILARQTSRGPVVNGRITTIKMYLARAPHQQ